MSLIAEDPEPGAIGQEEIKYRDRSQEIPGQVHADSVGLLPDPS